jgi:hypothetical protein
LAVTIIAIIALYFISDRCFLLAQILFFFHRPQGPTDHDGYQQQHHYQQQQ